MQLQQSITTCGTADPASYLPPPKAILYLSLRGAGTVTYTCSSTGVPNMDYKEQATLANEATDPIRWTGSVFVNPQGFVQWNVGTKLNVR